MRAEPGALCFMADHVDVQTRLDGGILGIIGRYFAGEGVWQNTLVRASPPPPPHRQRQRRASACTSAGRRVGAGLRESAPVSARGRLWAPAAGLGSSPNARFRPLKNVTPCSAGEQGHLSRVCRLPPAHFRQGGAPRPQPPRGLRPLPAGARLGPGRILSRRLSFCHLVALRAATNAPPPSRATPSLSRARRSLTSPPSATSPSPPSLPAGSPRASLAARASSSSASAGRASPSSAPRGPSCRSSWPPGSPSSSTRGASSPSSPRSTSRCAPFPESWRPERCGEELLLTPLPPHPAPRSFQVRYVGSVRRALFAGEGLFYATLTGPGLVVLQSVRCWSATSSAAPSRTQRRRCPYVSRGLSLFV